jgi:ABC-type dipeptide/oligopeptide/nickel transport system permease subunit
LTFSLSFTKKEFICPVILVTRVTGGFVVVISTEAGIVSGYFINQANRIKRIKTDNIIDVPHLRILLGGFPIISLTGSEYNISGF